MFFHLRVRTRAAAILRLVAPIALVSAILTSPGVGAEAGSVDVFRLVSNIRGESRDHQFAGAIIVHSANEGHGQAGPGTGAAAGMAAGKV